ncbi:outer membrane protein assembly factor BamD [Campylobacterota bacterium]|nr:outer membrane protein assembly factor BamD [Campylobacterota bacterium]
MKTNIILFFAVAALAIGCAKPDITGQTAEYYYRQMAEQISRSNLDSAGEYYASLSGEHISSTLLREATLLMAYAHIDKEEYLLANFYLDEHLKRFGSKDNSDRIGFIKLLADYKGIKRALRDQKLLLDLLQKAQEYEERYPNSEFICYAQTLKTKTLLAKSELDGKISALYYRLDKPLAQKYYDEQSKLTLKEDGEFRPTTTWWPKSWLE